VVHPLAIESMRERGIDLTAQRSKGMESLGPLEFDAVVTMGCGDVCPAVPARRRFDWAIPDPKHLPPEAFRAVRDRIDAEVACLLAEL
jgi:protein-tyrosine-phosphatase